MTGLPVKVEPETTPVEAHKPRWIDAHLADARNILDMHQFRRPDCSASEDAFIKKFILPLGGVEKDLFGNHYKLIGSTKPKIMWSAHTDTVHDIGGIQKLSLWGPKGGNAYKKLKLHSDEKVSNCLGADDGAGLWMLTELIKAEVPGIYIFHRLEERGGRGARYVLENHADVVHGVKAAIAFDRRGKKDIITHQCSKRTASDEFARALAVGLGMDHQPSDAGMFTDTEIYRQVIPECTNIAAGYEGAHWKNESLDLEYLIALRDAVLKVDFESLPICRDPSRTEYKSYSYPKHNQKPYRYDHAGTGANDGWEKDYDKTKPSDFATQFDSHTPDKEPTTVEDYVKKYPAAVASMLEEWGIDLKNLKVYVEDSRKALPALPKPDETV